MLRALLFLFLAFADAAAQASAVEKSDGEVLSPRRIAALPRAQRDAWTTYITRSSRLHAMDTSAMRAELRTLGVERMRKAPYSAPEFRFWDRDSSWFASDSAKRLAESLLSWQTRSGGWSKRTDMRAPREPGVNFYSESESWHYAPTFDNGGTTGQLRFLMRMLRHDDGTRYAKAVERGLQLILDAQQPNGCWPQSYPLEGGYHDGITFNDDVTVNILRLLDDIARGTFTSLPARLGPAATNAAARGVACLLRTQVMARGRRTVWGQQHDPITLEIIPARSYELAGLTSRESASILTYLMSLPKPSPAVVRAVEAAAEWFVAHAMWGYRYDGELKRDSSGRVVWARLTEVATDRPIFANRDGIKLYDWEKLTDRRTGYGWFTTEPADALARYQEWKRMHARSR